eukprot:m51a1_g1727 hypothetical protein (209) ;mRNA; r:131985-132883
MASQPSVAHWKSNRASKASKDHWSSGRFTKALCAEIRPWAEQQRWLVDTLRVRTKAGATARVILSALADHEDLRAQLARTGLPTGPEVEAVVAGSPWMQRAMSCVPEDEEEVRQRTGIGRADLAKLTLVVRWSVHSHAARASMAQSGGDTEKESEDDSDSDESDWLPPAARAPKRTAPDTIEIAAPAAKKPSQQAPKLLYQKNPLLRQ